MSGSEGERESVCVCEGERSRNIWKENRGFKAPLPPAVLLLKQHVIQSECGFPVSKAMGDGVGVGGGGSGAGCRLLKYACGVVVAVQSADYYFYILFLSSSQPLFCSGDQCVCVLLLPDHLGNARHFTITLI